MNIWIVGIGGAAVVGVGIFFFARFRMRARQESLLKRSTDLQAATKGQTVPDATRENLITGTRSEGLTVAFEGIL